ncbi:MAG: threonine ammonia-lyase, biosynthetic [Thioalkalispiraceae bacterium]|jgi:threonine dehydratase
MFPELVAKIKKASVYEVAVESPIDYAPLLSKRLENQVFLKREDLQSVFSFKLRGAYNKISNLSDQERQRGIIAASAGNHAQGVALAAQRLGIKATIVMPKTTPRIKVNSVASYGAKIILHGNTYDDACAHAYKLAEAGQLTFIHPYDDLDVISGQGTVAVEILAQMKAQGRSVDAIFVPVGGGGLISGISAYVKSVDPSIRIIGVEAEDSACLHAALQAGERVELEQVGIFADGVAVRKVGEYPFEIARQCVDDVVLASTDEICAAIKDIFDDTRSIAEPAGALAVAGMKRYLAKHPQSGKTFVVIDSGANMNFDRLRHVAERAELGEHREAIVAVTIPERPGSFRQFCEIIGMRGITEFNYRYSDPDNAHVFVGVQMQSGEQEKDELINKLKDKDYPVLDMTDNEMAKLHIRYMVGGRVAGVKNERLYRFEFPERPGALLRFLNNMGQQWNISLFHYRNHGAAYGRVLVGMQVPDGEEQQFRKFLGEIGYPYWEETDNPAYALFLN